MFDVAVIGGGQAALAAGYYLRRSGLSFVLLDEQAEPGGAWRHTWPSLRLFSPSQWSSLPGWLMPSASAVGGDVYPTRDAVVEYLSAYERRYELPVERNVRIMDVRSENDLMCLQTRTSEVRARAVISATGTWANPVVPMIPGQETYRGSILHSAHYTGPAQFGGRRVVVVGGGNSGAQLVAELSEIATVTWATREPPTFLPDDVNGRYLFEQATARYRAVQEGRSPDPPRSLGDVVMVPPVRAARERGWLNAVSMFTRFHEDGVEWPDGRVDKTDAIIFATGFRPALGHFATKGLLNARGRVDILAHGSGTRAAHEPRVWLLGYGEWTGFASATLIGVGRSARATIDEITTVLGAGGQTR